MLAPHFSPPTLVLWANIGGCKIDITPLQMHWSYTSFAPSNAGTLLQSSLLGAVCQHWWVQKRCKSIADTLELHLLFWHKQELGLLCQRRWVQKKCNSIADTLEFHLFCFEISKSKVSCARVGGCKRDVTPLLMHWSYISFAPTNAGSPHQSSFLGASIVGSKRDVTPLLTHWSYISFAPTNAGSPPQSLLGAVCGATGSLPTKPSSVWAACHSAPTTQQHQAASLTHSAASRGPARSSALTQPYMVEYHPWTFSLWPIQHTFMGMDLNM